QEVSQCECDGTEEHRPPRAEHLVAHPAADRRGHVDQGGSRAPHQGRALVGELQTFHHVVHDQRLHAVVAEALPHLDQEYGGEASTLGNGIAHGLFVVWWSRDVWYAARPRHVCAIPRRPHLAPL